MIPSLAVEVPKEDLPSLHFPNRPVQLSALHRRALETKIQQVMTLGNNEHCKCRILFKDHEGMKYVETTVWSFDREHIVLKSGITVPIARVIDVDLV